jgi:hypothetical protein
MIYGLFLYRATFSLLSAAIWKRMETGAFEPGESPARMPKGCHNVYGACDAIDPVQGINSACQT